MKKFQNFLTEIFHFLVVKFSVYTYLNRHVFVMDYVNTPIQIYRKFHLDKMKIFR